MSRTNKNNKGGRPKHERSIVAALKREFENDPRKLKQVAERLIKLAIGGNLNAIKEIGNRLDGLPREVRKIEGELPIRLVFTPVDNIRFKPAEETPALKKVDVIEGQAMEIE